MRIASPLNRASLGIIYLIMVVLQCPIVGCDFATADVEAVGTAALLNVHGSVHITNNATPPPATKKPDRPEIDGESSDSDWNLFLFEWERYKRATRLDGNDQAKDELLNCCKPSPRSRLFQMAGNSLSTLTEQALLERIKDAAVLSVHKVVHRAEFSKLAQEEGESVAHFVARLKSKATLCDFTVEATQAGSISYQEDMVEGQMITGLYNNEHRVRLLTEADKLPTFQEKYNALTTMHTTDLSTSQLNASTSAVTQRKSEYVRSKWPASQSGGRKEGTKKLWRRIHQ